MRLGNLWFFFYLGNAAPAVVEEESRVFRPRYHAHAHVTGFSVRPTLGRVSAITSALAPAQGLRVRASLGKALGKASSVAQASLSGRTARIAPVSVAAAAQAFARATLSAPAQVSAVSTQASAFSRSASIRRPISLGRSSVEIGVNVVEQELEELLFLLEVA